MSGSFRNGKHYTKYLNRYLIAIIALLSFVISGSSTLMPANDEWIIVIDPGHGGKDPGAVGSYSYEKNITLAVALKTGEYIKKNISNTRVIYTRDKDVFLGLNERAEIANKYNADLFISIHANAHPLKSTYGTETYVMGHSKDEENLKVAMKENEVIMLESDYSTNYQGFDPKSPESYIMFTLMQSAFSEQSLNLAAAIQAEYKTRVGRYDRGVKQAGFWVLWKTTMPSVLTEIGFITNTNEEKYLNSVQGQDYLASAIYRACRDYVAEIERKSSISTARQDTVLPEDAPAKTGGIPGQSIFRVQIAASSKRIPLKPENFRQIKDVQEIASGNRYRYVTGTFNVYSKAVEYRKLIEKTYPDAFVIAIKENKVIPLQEALEKINK
jgi:N-acetylmuramoyl-L-alanine amidase